MFMHDSDRASNVEENRSMGAASSVAAVSSGTPSQLFTAASSQVGVVAGHRSAWSCRRSAF